MDRITVAEALRFAAQNFPQAPELLAELLDIEVRRSSLNCDGWCLQVDHHAIIRINNKTPEVRQRFTLAHELGHLILGIPSVIGESMFDVQNLKNKEEELVNAFAGELLLPLDIVKSFIPEIPVTSAAIKKIARKANVSELFVARRLASLAAAIGLKDGLVVFYENGLYKWQWSNTVKLLPGPAQDLLDKCLVARPNPARMHREAQRDVIVASLLANPHLNTTTVFVQVVEEADGLRKLNEESIRKLEEFVFENFRHFQPSLQGCFSAMKSRVHDLTLDEAVKLFNTLYLHDSKRWDESFRNRLKCARGQQYVRLRLKVWVTR